ncbi:glycosyl transferase [Pleurocapsa sp. CCALA 161]|uniref:glycosyltransferase family 4 protein n=1 Tax=Pleurocapsa sp. CCALA 161 TaxID=2107688 RepID=UPI000D05CCF3|nr:glycosyltransferase family 4 protein [Pleurocapsa sp. CCALA 161]PSB06156.1 glycosyl transferase [Pleurocapsa sp. CCALA 161]
MKILHISTKDLEGGGPRAAYRLHRGLQNINISSQMLVQQKMSSDRTVIAPQTNLEKGLAKIGGILDTIPSKFYRQREPALFSTQWLPDAICSRIARLDVDLINLHWVEDNYLRIETMAKLGQPIVWTLHDMWAFTGGCHYDDNCGRYVESCGACPQLKSDRQYDLSRWVWQRKFHAWKNLPLTIVTPSEWLAKCAGSSSLFKNLRVEVIPNGVDIQRYKPVNRPIVRELIGLPQNKHLVMFGAIKATSDRRKGFYFLQAALESLCQSGWQNKLELVVVGASQPEKEIYLGFKTHYLGKLNDDISLAQVYAAADVFVAPSVQDNLPNTVVEAIACGTPAVAFNIGGMPEIIEHHVNGYLAQPFEIEDLAKGIVWILENQERHQKLGDRARAKAKQEFSQELQARRYASLYRTHLTLNPNC